MNKNLEKRFWEVDFLRGLAIIMMIIFHLLYDLNYFGDYSFALHSGFWWIFARLTATIFIFLVSVSLTLRYSGARRHGTGEKLYVKYLKRGLEVFGWGLIITLVTWIFLRQGFIIFGILHFIGLSTILAYPFLKLRFRALLLGIILIFFGMYLQNFTLNSYWLVWLGFMPLYFFTLDYFPVLPWFGVILIGLFFGNSLYPNYTRRFNLPDLSNLLFIRQFCFLGRHSLLIYLIHQPILIGILYLFVL